MESINKYQKDDENLLFQRSLINPAHKKNIKTMIIFFNRVILSLRPVISLEWLILSEIAFFFNI